MKFVNLTEKTFYQQKHEDMVYFEVLIQIFFENPNTPTKNYRQSVLKVF